MMLKNKQQVVVIGAGVAGLASAIRLARRGCVVKVIESGPGPGGKMSEIRKNGFRFDTGPSLFTLPHLVEELLENDWNDKYQQLDLITRYFWDDGTMLNAWAEPGRFALAVESTLQESASQVLAYLAQAKFLYEHTANMFIFSPLNRASTYFSKNGLKALKALPVLKAWRTMHQENSRWFSNSKTIQLFDRFATYNGSNPFMAPATLTMIPHLEHNLGVWFPKRGMHQIARDLEIKAQNLGVEFFYNTPAHEIIMQNQYAVAVKTSRSLFPSDIVVSDVDISHVYGQLLPYIPLPQRYAQKVPSSSAIIFYWGMRRTTPALDVHNILFSNNYRAEFEALMQGSLADDLTVYLFISSKMVPDDAPKDCENWFAMVNAPYDQGQDWNALREKARNIILKKIKNVLQIDVLSDIAVEDYADPPLIEKRTGSYRGALYGISSNDPMAAFLRHPNHVYAFKNIYFVGGSVHPGGGIPLCLASAQIVDKLIPK